MNLFRKISDKETTVYPSRYSQLIILAGLILYAFVLWVGLKWIGSQTVLAGYLMVAVVTWFVGMRLGLLTAFSMILSTYYLMPIFLNVKNTGMRVQGVVGSVFIIIISLAVGWVSSIFHKLKQTQELLVVEHKKTELLLKNIMPESMVNQLKKGDILIADHYLETTILFCELVGYFELSKTMVKDQWLNLLNVIVTEFNVEAEYQGISSVKTIGDAYIVVGLLEQKADHAEIMARMALNMQRVIAAINIKEYRDIQLRIGMHSGPVIGGVIGENRFTLDMWGDTVNMASRLESHGQAGKIHISEETFQLINHRFYCVSAGNTHLKNYGERKTYFVEGLFEKH